jgi:hypothetical protein
MDLFIMVFLSLGYVCIMISGLWKTARDLIARPFPQLARYSDAEVNSTDILPGRPRSLSQVSIVLGEVRRGPHNREFL